MKPYRLLATDLDDTLLLPDGTVGAQTRAVLTTVMRAGITVCLASARTASMMNLFAPPNLNCDYWIACNGASLHQIPERTLLFSHPLPQDAAARILTVLTAAQISCTVATDEVMYYTASDQRIVKRLEQFAAYCQAAGITEPFRAFPLNSEGQPEAADMNRITKIVAYLRDDPVKTNAVASLTEDPAITTAVTGKGMLGFFAAGVSKQAALEDMQRRLGISRAETIACGDSANDLPLFAAAGLRVAVANGDETLKQQADVIVPPNDQEGVARFLMEHIIKIPANKGGHHAGSS